MQTSISIIIPLYNKRTAIKETLLSIIQQDFNNFEIIVIDDGSTDGSNKIVQEIKDNRIKYFYKENGGVSSARNLGIEKSSGKYILFLDADDLLLPSSLKTFFYAAEKYEVDLVSAPCLSISNNDQYIRGNRTKSKKINNPYKELYYARLLPITGTYIVKKDKLKKIRFNEKHTLYEDWEFAFQLYDICTVYTLNKPSTAYRQEYCHLSKLRETEKNFLYNLEYDSRFSFWKKMTYAYLIFQSINVFYPDDKDFLKNKYKKFMPYYHLFHWHARFRTLFNKITQLFKLNYNGD